MHFKANLRNCTHVAICYFERYCCCVFIYELKTEEQIAINQNHKAVVFIWRVKNKKEH